MTKRTAEEKARRRELYAQNRDSINAERRARRVIDPRIKARAEAYRKAHLAEVNASARKYRADRPGLKRSYRLTAQYRMTGEQYEALVASQGGGCAICGVSLTSATAHIDHDHACCSGNRNAPTCGKCVRGVLCSDCNLGIGRLSDDPERLMAAARYIEQWRMSRLEANYASA